MNLTKKRKSLFTKVLSVYLALTLTFSHLSPFFLLAAHVQAAQVDTTQQSLQQPDKISFNPETHSLEVNFTQQNTAISYALYYEYNEVLDAAMGQTSSDSASIFIGTQSGENTNPLFPSRAILKVQTQGSNVVFSSQLELESYEEQASVEVPFVSYKSSSLALTSSETLWLSHGVHRVDSVDTNVNYEYPLNKLVSVTFTQLPEDGGSLRMAEVKLSDKQVEELGAASATAYEITSSMKNGTFEYDLTLPNPIENSDVTVQYSEDGENFEQATGNELVTEQKDGQNVVRITGLDHFTVFVVTGAPVPVGVDCQSAGASIGGECFEDLQSAVNAAASGDTIELKTDLSTSSQITINNKTLIINGNGHTISPTFTKTSNSNNSVLGISGEAHTVTFNDVKINGIGGTDLHGINVYVSNVNLNNVEIHNNDNTAININGSHVNINNISTSGNATKASFGTFYSYNVIELAKGSGVSRNPILEVTGQSIHLETQGMINRRHILTKSGTVTDVHNQYNKSGNYFVLKPAPEAPVITQPTQNQVLSSVLVNMSWDSVPYASKYEYEITPAVGDKVTGSTSNTSISEVLSYGDQTLRVRSVASSGLAGDWSTERNFSVVDSTPPTVPVILQPVQGHHFNSKPIANQWTASIDEGSGVQKYQVAYLYDDGHSFGGSTCPGEKIDGEILSGCRDVTTGTSRNHQPANTEQGGVKIWVRAFDVAGNVSAWSVPVHYYYDITKPVSELTSPLSNTVWKNPISISGNSNDNIAIKKVYIDYSDASENNWQSITALENTNHDLPFSWNYSWTPPLEGKYDLRVRAEDQAGNLEGTEYAYNVAYDVTAPTITITHPANNSVHNTSVELRGSVQDENPRHYWLNIKRDGVQIFNETVLSNSFENALLQTLTQDGKYVVTFAAHDSAGGGASTGNRSEDLVISFTIDTQAPEAPAWITSPFITRLADVNRPGDNQGANIKFSASASEDVTSYQYQFVRLNLDGTHSQTGTNVLISPSICIAGICNWNNVTLEKNQMWLYRLRAIDHASNTSNWTDWKDLTNEQFSNLRYQSVSYEDFLNKTGAFSEANGYSADSSTGFTIREEVLPTSVITVPDSAGGVVATADSSITIKYTAQDEHTGVEKVALYVSNDSGDTFSQALTSNIGEFEFEFPAEGEYCFYTQAIDIANMGIIDAGVGNTELAKGCELSVLYDNTDPTAPTDLSVTPTSPTNQTSQTWSWSASTDIGGSGIFRYFYQVLGASSEIVTSGHTKATSVTTLLLNGLYSFFVQAEDNVGNMSYNAELADYLVDTVHPKTQITSPVIDQVISGTHTFTGESTDSDPSSGMKNVIMRIDTQDDNTNMYSTVLGLNTETGEWSHEVDTETIPDGYYNVSARTQDNAGNDGIPGMHVLRDFIIDNSGPEISNITMLVNGEASALAKPGDTVRISATIIDEYLDVDRVRIIVRQRPNTSDTILLPNQAMQLDPEVANTYFIEFTVPATYTSGEALNQAIDGNFFRIRAWDVNNNISSAGQNRFTIDSVLPQSSITGPGEVDPNDQTTIVVANWDGSVYGLATDTAPGRVAGVELEISRTIGVVTTYWNGSEWSSDPNSRVEAESTDDFANWSYQIPAPASGELTSGTYTVISRAYDTAGNKESSARLIIVLDREIPEVTISVNPTNPDGQNNWYKTRPTVTLTDNGTYSGTKAIQYSWNNSTGPWTTYTGPFQIPAQGSYVLYYRAINNADVPSETGIKNLRWDETTLTRGPINVSANPSRTSGSISTISWDAATDNIGIERYEIVWKLKNSGPEYSKSVSSSTRETEIDRMIQEGEWEVFVRAFDPVGNMKDGATLVTVDRTAPAAPTLVLAGTSIGSASLTWNAVESASRYIVYYGVNSGEYIFAASVGNTTAFTVQGLAADTYYFMVRAVDDVDNQSSNSNEVTTGAIAGAPGTIPGAGGTAPAAGFDVAGDVLGVADDTESAKAIEFDKDGNQISRDGEVAGAIDENCSTMQQHLPWILLAVLTLSAGAIELLLKRHTGLAKMGIVISLLVAVIGTHYMFNNPNCFVTGSITNIVNNWFIGLVVVIAGLIRLAGYAFIEEVEI
jgi:hypothetical protein